MKKLDNSKIFVLILAVLIAGLLIGNLTGQAGRKRPPGPGPGPGPTTIPACQDVDHDGYGVNCLLGNDCNNNDASINPGMKEICGNNIDEDCDGKKLASCSTANVDVNIDSNDYLFTGGSLEVT